MRRTTTRNRPRGWIVLALAVLLPAPAAVAADPGYPPMPPAPYAEPTYAGTWSGLYAGVHGGIGAFTGTAIDWGDDAFDGPDGDINLDAFAGIAGGQVGFNHQEGNIVYGVEGDLAWTGFDADRTFDDDYYVRSRMDWLATLRGRLGVAEGNALAYISGGVAFAGMGGCANDTHASPCSIGNDQDTAWSGVKPGFVAGAGVEARLTERLSVKGEYLYVRMAAEDVAYDTGSASDIVGFFSQSHLLRLGLNYHFAGLPLAEPVASGPWSGVYGGVFAGAGAFTGTAFDWGDDIFDDPDGDIDLDAFAGVAGGQVGVNHQAGNVVYGLEGDLAWSGFDSERTFDEDHYVKAKMDWLATARGRLGLASGNAMAYVTGGIAFASVSHCANDTHTSPCLVGNDQDTAWSGVKPGLVAGAGVEARLNEKLSIKGEYLYVQTASENVAYDTGSASDIVEFSSKAHLLRLGLNYHFNGLPMVETANAGPWSGFYGGVQAGGGAFAGTATDWDFAIFDDPDGDIDLNAFAGVAGGQIGVNHQAGNVVYGLEGDIAWTSYDESRTFDADYYARAKMDWLATVRGRLGLAAGNAMAYVTGGVALAGLSHCANDTHTSPCSTGSEDAAWNGVKAGFTAGAGVEAMFGPNWSLKGEYLYTQTARENVEYDTDDFVEFSNRSHLFRVGLNYHLNGASNH